MPGAISSGAAGGSSLKASSVGDGHWDVGLAFLLTSVLPALGVIVGLVALLFRSQGRAYLLTSSSLGLALRRVWFGFHAAVFLRDVW